jgi:hypothetical protein
MSWAVKSMSVSAGSLWRSKRSLNSTRRGRGTPAITVTTWFSRIPKSVVFGRGPTSGYGEPRWLGHIRDCIRLLTPVMGPLMGLSFHFSSRSIFGDRETCMTMTILMNFPTTIGHPALGGTGFTPQSPCLKRGMTFTTKVLDSSV